MAQKTVLIVYAHQSPGSFNAAVRNVTVKALEEQGCRVIMSDLYAMNFRANATYDDIIGDWKNPELFQYGEETMHAWKEGRLSEDIVAEQNKIKEADLVIFQFPLYWFSVPAIMKGWMDRVLTQGFAFSLEKMYNNGVFKDKKAMLSFSTGAMPTMFRPDGINGDINVTLWPLQNGILHFCGFQVLAPQIFWCPVHSPHVARTAMLEGWQARLKGLFAERPLTFAPCELFDLSFQGGFLLHPSVREEYRSLPYGITTGHHLGKPLPPDNQITAQPPDENSGNSASEDNQITAQPPDEDSANSACEDNQITPQPPDEDSANSASEDNQITAQPPDENSANSACEDNQITPQPPDEDSANSASEDNQITPQPPDEDSANSASEDNQITAQPPDENSANSASED
ncbi:NAD(P)H dehydrogenase [quinone] 1 [Myripristis murdjan]|uniref:NAD(P)H dehydrogenase [quinone] 1 n=1 Tax=Myripristis murdjan TaxID=586833 RepID=UPI001175EF92|nr:NAD(P)H dehydrogenase [quinone] 1-like [Myripristis murdjan]XP_029903772.1 NAD(P)H dehydrogenase [quinone] 1-like [Myripristis murdjan]